MFKKQTLLRCIILPAVTVGASIMCAYGQSTSNGSAPLTDPCAAVKMPSGTLCISQAAGNAAARNIRELAAKDEKIAILESALAEKDASIAAYKELANKNTEDLKAALHRTEVDLAAKTGEIVACNANVTRQLAVIEILAKNSRAKKIGLFVF